MITDNDGRRGAAILTHWLNHNPEGAHHILTEARADDRMEALARGILSAASIAARDRDTQEVDPEFVERLRQLTLRFAARDAAD